mmetsp:Transcript_30505/g.99145  ORF Transcript_30505/g.99145 Transcript_30505/m.99145 type:complete len:621 (-) Transcript_30505:54-1916(-)
MGTCFSSDASATVVEGSDVERRTREAADSAPCTAGDAFASGSYAATGERLGGGVQGVVLAATRVSDGAAVAVKEVRIGRFQQAHLREAARAELACLSRMNHPRVGRLLEPFMRPNVSLQLVMERVRGVSMLTYLAQGLKATEEELPALAAERHALLRQLVEAVAHVHSKSVVFRDLSLHNTMVTDDEPRSLKLIDFGSACILERHERITNARALGTSLFQAPEVEAGEPYGQQADLWAVGVFVYLLVGGSMPFEHSAHGIHQVLRAEFRPFNEAFSPEARDLVQRLLVRRPERRLNAVQCLQHRFFTSTSSVDNLKKSASTKALLSEASTGHRRASIRDLEMHHVVVRKTAGILASLITEEQMQVLRNWVDMSMEGSVKNATPTSVPETSIGFPPPTPPAESGGSESLVLARSGSGLSTRASSNEGSRDGKGMGALKESGLIMRDSSWRGQSTLGVYLAGIGSTRLSEGLGSLGFAHANGLCSFDELLVAVAANGYKVAAQELERVHGELQMERRASSEEAHKLADLPVFFRVAPLFDAVARIQAREGAGGWAAATAHGLTTHGGSAALRMLAGGKAGAPRTPPAGPKVSAGSMSPPLPATLNSVRSVGNLAATPPTLRL